MSKSLEKSSKEKVDDWYEKYNLKNKKDRNELTNPEVLFQYLAFENSVLCALRKAVGLARDSAKILDVGCGSGGSLARFLSLGFDAINLYGVDITPDAIVQGQKKYPNFQLRCADAAALHFENDSFDMVMESGMFIQITDEVLSAKICDEMLRLTKPGGYVMLIDWRYGKPGNQDYLGLSKARIHKLFSVGTSCEIVCQTDGALVPPVGRVISKYMPSIYFLVRALLPFLTGQKTTLLQKMR